MDELDKKISDLIDQYDELDKEYISYLEADMNREAKKIQNKMYKIEYKIAQLEDEKEYGLKSDMKRTIQLYRKFINYKGMSIEFENFVEKEGEEEENEQWYV